MYPITITITITITIIITITITITITGVGRLLFEDFKRFEIWHATVRPGE
jgi:hypothetical protein